MEMASQGCPNDLSKFALVQDLTLGIEGSET